MEPVVPVNTYAARPAGSEMLRLGDGISAFKIYYVDIIGRSDPSRFEWDACGRDRSTISEGLARLGVSGVGFVTAFPHITKVFRFAPSAETILHVRAYSSADFSEISLDRDAGYVECACLAEAVIAADEYRFWAEAPSVETYLERWCDWPLSPIVDNTKLATYVGRRSSPPAAATAEDRRATH